MRALVLSYVTVLAPLLARWLKRRRKEQGETCERSEDLVERQFCAYFFDPMHCAETDFKSEGRTQIKLTAILRVSLFFALFSLREKNVYFWGMPA